MKRLAVFGAGMQGVAAAYDCGRYGAFDRIILVDIDLARAKAGASRVNRLLGDDLCQAVHLDATRREALLDFLPSVDLAVSALPYQFHHLVEDVAVEVGCSVVDMGQDPEPALAIHSRSKEAGNKGVAIVTDCGLAPGLVNVFAADLISRCDGATHVRSYCGGLPHEPIEPLGYAVRFSMDSVIGEYSDEVLALRNGEVVSVAPMEFVEQVEFEGFGTLEAFTTSGGTGTAPYSFRGEVLNYEYKTMRYPGHSAAMKLFRECGFWSEEPLSRIGVSPRQAFSAVMEKRLAFPNVPDVVLVRVEAQAPHEILRLEMIEREDPETGFTAMERLTGFSTAIVALEICAGRIAPGCYGCETAVDPVRFQQELEQRGIQVRRSSLSTSPAP